MKPLRRRYNKQTACWGESKEGEIRPINRMARRIDNSKRQHARAKELFRTMQANPPAHPQEDVEEDTQDKDNTQT